MKNSSINLRVSEELRTYLEGMANKNEKNLSDFIRFVLEEKMNNENKLEEDYEILKIMVIKMKKALEDSNRIHIKGEYSTLEIEYDDFEINANIWKSEDLLNGDVWIKFNLYKDSNLIFTTSLAKETQFEIKNILNKKRLFITKF